VIHVTALWSLRRGRIIASSRHACTIRLPTKGPEKRAFGEYCKGTLEIPILCLAVKEEGAKTGGSRKLYATNLHHKLAQVDPS